MMRISACKNNQKFLTALTVEKLSGRGVLCSKSAVYLSQILQEKMDCIFVAEINLTNNQPLTN